MLPHTRDVPYSSKETRKGPERVESAEFVTTKLRTQLPEVKI